LVLPSTNPIMNTYNVPTTQMEAPISTRMMSNLVMIGSSFLLGGTRETDGSVGSTPNDCATGPSQMISN
jgi:hypothetical protein